MSLIKRIAHNTIIHTAGKFSASLIGVFVVAILTRYLGTEGYGEYTTIFAYLFFFSAIADLGLYLVTINNLGRSDIDKNKFINNIFTLRFFSAILILIFACALIWFFPYTSIIKFGVLITSLSIFFMLLDQLTVGIFQKELKTITPSIVEIISKLIILSTAIVCYKLNLNLLYILSGIVIAHGLHFIINFIFVNKLLKENQHVIPSQASGNAAADEGSLSRQNNQTTNQDLNTSLQTDLSSSSSQSSDSVRDDREGIRFEFDFSYWKKIISISWPVAVTGIFSLIYFKADTLVLSLYYPQNIVGLYGAPYKILEVLIGFPAIFMGLVSPQLAKFYSEKDKNNFQKIFSQSFNLLSILVLPMILGTIALSQPIIRLIAGTEFLASAPILQILIIACGIIFMAHLSTFTVVAIGQQKRMIKYYIISAILALLAYFIFIPTYSYWAAAIITVLVELFIFLSSLIMVKRSTQIRINLNIFFRAFLASIIMFLILNYLPSLNIFILIPIGIFSYSLFLFLFKGISKQTILEIFPTK